jgi:hypothetical protein
MTSKMFDPNYQLCVRCDEYKPVDDFWIGSKEYKLCGACRKPLRGRPGITHAEHERRKAKRIARKTGETE